MIQREAEVKNKVTAVALTDSVHNVWHQEAGKTIREWMREVRPVSFFFKSWGVYACIRFYKHFSYLLTIYLW